MTNMEAVIFYVGLSLLAGGISAHFWGLDGGVITAGVSLMCSAIISRAVIE